MEHGSCKDVFEKLLFYDFSKSDVVSLAHDLGYKHDFDAFICSETD